MLPRDLIHTEEDRSSKDALAGSVEEISAVSSGTFSVPYGSLAIEGDAALVAGR